MWAGPKGGRDKSADFLDVEHVSVKRAKGVPWSNVYGKAKAVEQLS